MKIIVFSFFALILILSGCTPNVQPTAAVAISPSSKLPSSAPNMTPSPSPSSSQTTDIAVYYLKESNNEIYMVREVHKLTKTEAVARAALNELISGNIISGGAFRVLPQDTKILGIKIEDGLATVDFSKEVLNAKVGAAAEELGILSIVNTLTEFPTVQKVQFTVEGNAENGKDWWGHVGLYKQPFQRDLSKVYLPVIWVSSPVSGQKISSPFNLQGSARVFEASVSYRLKDTSGNLLAQGYVMASAGAPGRGGFGKIINFTPTGSGNGTLEVYEVSMKDGSEVSKVTISVNW